MDKFEKRHMEDGLFELSLKRMLKDKEYLKNHKIDENTIMDTKLFNDYKLFQLQSTIQYAYENSKFYHNLFDKVHIKPTDLKNFKDLEKFPFTTADDLSGSSYDFLCVSQGNVTKPVTFYSSGATGLRKRMYYSMNDVERIMDFLGVGMNCVMGSECVAQILLPNSQGRGITSTLAKSLNSLGMKAYGSNMELTSKELMQLTLDNHPNVWFGDTSTIYRATKESEKFIDLKKLGVKILFLTIGQVSNELKIYLENAWNCKVITHYGLTEMGWGLAVDCDESDGYHYNELDVYAEIVAADGNEVLEDGKYGELVFTSLNREAMPLIRYRSKDVSALYHSKCKCNHNLQLMKHIVKRTNGGFITKTGKEIYPQLFDEILYATPCITDYRLYINRTKNLINIEIELNEKTNNIEDQIISRIKKIEALQNSDIIINVNVVLNGALKPYCFEKKRFVESGD
ncbi:MAG: DVU_1553 family AMP-dependent CoA ligase [Sedimentibacter sp.]